MNTSERVLSYLNKHMGKKICDDCLRQELRVRSSLRRMLDVLNREYVHRQVLSCSCCGQERMGVEQFKAVEKRPRPAATWIH